VKDILADILAARRVHVERAKESVSPADLDRRAKAAPAPLDFEANLLKSGRIALIAEIKRRSPSAGEIRADFSVGSIAKAYERGGATALSVLTEPDWFGGRLADMDEARDAASLPILRKDFIFDPYQLAEARLHRADAVLLIAGMIGPRDLKELVRVARDFRLAPLVEVFSEGDVGAAVDSGARLIGINARNLRTLEMAPGNFERLARLVPSDRLLVAESGLKTRTDIIRVRDAGARAALIGESLLKRDDAEAAVRYLADGASWG
jgi:indole-3-glycerol phosphate synthase